MTFTNASIIFDLDGTLIDTAPDILRALNYVLEKVECPTLTLADMDKLVGDGAKALIETGLQNAEKSLDEIKKQTLLKEFLIFYSDNIAVSSQPFPGLQSCLERLKKDEAKLAVCTNKTENLAVKLLRELELETMFETIVGADTFAVRKPHPDHILGTLKRINGTPSHAVMIGDSKNDILAAKAANIPVIAVTFGYTPRPVQEFEPDITIDHYDELLPALKKLL